MKEFFCRLLTPWRAEEWFGNHDAFCQFLVRRDRILNRVRVLIFAVTAVLLLLGYALSNETRNVYYYAAAGCLAVALVLSLVIGENEKQLPKELRQK